MCPRTLSCVYNHFFADFSLGSDCKQTSVSYNNYMSGCSRRVPSVYVVSLNSVVAPPLTVAPYPCVPSTVLTGSLSFKKVSFFKYKFYIPFLNLSVKWFLLYSYRLFV